MRAGRLFELSKLERRTCEWMSNLLIELDPLEFPNAEELLRQAEIDLGLDARFVLLDVARHLSAFDYPDDDLQLYLDDLVSDGGLPSAIRGSVSPTQVAESSIDSLLGSTLTYSRSQDFKDMLEFMARFRKCAPYNNMLVKLQNPSCAFFASKRDWEERFGRNLKLDARPMLTLAFMGPVLCVYDLDQTEGPDLPAELTKFSKFEGPWNPGWLQKLTKNAAAFAIRVEAQELTSSYSGFATTRAQAPDKFRVALHVGLDDQSKFGVLCHELAHIFLGHLGSDPQGWWHHRTVKGHNVIEIEAESVAFLVTERFGIRGSSEQYLSRLCENATLPPGVSIDNIARVAGLIERMAKETVKPPRIGKAGARQ